MTLQLKPSPELKAILKHKQVRPPLRLKTLLTKEKHLKRLLELSEKSARQKPQLEEPTDEQKEWVIRKMKAPASSWRSFA
jgi:hypothetical protein